MEIKVFAERAKNGDMSAWGPLFEKTRDMVYFTTLKLVGNENTAEDLTQETYIRAMKNIACLNAPEAFVMWIKQIAVNVCRNHFAKKNPTLFGSDETDALIANMPEVEENFLPAEYADRKETCSIIMKMIDSLPEKQRMTVIMYYYNEFSVTQIAGMMQVSENTVKSRLNYARCQIREQVENMEKKGIKLHGAVPFLGLVLQRVAGDYTLSASASAAIMESMAATAAIGVGTAAGGAGGAAAANGAAAGGMAAGGASGAAGAFGGGVAGASTAAGGAVAKAVGVPLAIKIVAGVLGAGVAVGGGVAVKNAIAENSKAEKYQNTDYSYATTVNTGNSYTDISYETDPAFLGTTEPVAETEIPEAPTEPERDYVAFKSHYVGKIEVFTPMITLNAGGTGEYRFNVNYGAGYLDLAWEKEVEDNLVRYHISVDDTYNILDNSRFTVEYRIGDTVATLRSNGDIDAAVGNGSSFDIITEKKQFNFTKNADVREVLEEFWFREYGMDDTVTEQFADVTHDGIDDLIVMENTTDPTSEATYTVYSIVDGEIKKLYVDGTEFTTNQMYFHYLYYENGEAYLVWRNWVDGQGYPNAKYEVFYLNESGEKIVVAARDTSTEDITGDRWEYCEAVYEESDKYVENSEILVIPIPIPGEDSMDGKYYMGTIGASYWYFY